MLSECDKIKISDMEVRFNKYGRHSTRDNKDHNLRGQNGYITITGDLSNIINMIKIASQLNIGKSCTMGFGKFHIEE